MFPCERLMLIKLIVQLKTISNKQKQGVGLKDENVIRKRITYLTERVLYRKLKELYTNSREKSTLKHSVHKTILTML